jgi:hypothetical protein
MISNREEPMTPLPTESLFREVLADQGRQLTEARLAAALASHRNVRRDIERLRAIPQSFLEPVLEPATAMRWLENGGKSL